MKKTDLYDLIHSLTKSEKRYFKLQSQRQGAEGNYLRIFDILEKQPVFDEKALREQFDEATFLNQLHVTKNYLREKILDSLRSFYSRMSRDATVKELLRNVEILFLKELFDQANDELQRAESLANEYELHTAQIEVSRWKRKLEQTQYPNRFERFAEILKEQEKALDALQNNLECWQTILRSSQKFMRRNVDFQREEGIGISQDFALSLESKVLYFNTLYVESLRKGNQDQAEKALLDLIEILENRPARVKDDPASYLTTVNNLAGFYVFRQEGEKALELFRRTRVFLGTIGLPDSRRPVLKQLVRTLNIELEIYRHASDPAPFEPFFQDAESFVKKSASKMPGEYLISFQFQFAWICFLKKDFDGALSWINQSLNEGRKFSGQPVFRAVLILNLMIHCERRNLFVLRYFVESARRQFKKSGEIRSFEQELLHFFSKIGQAPTREFKPLYLELRNRLFPENAPSIIPPDAAQMMDLRRWLS